MQRDQHLFPVVEVGCVVGIITEGALRALSVEGQREHLTNAGALMQPPFVVREDEDLHQVLSKMLERDLHAAVVLDKSGAIIGLLHESEIGAAYHQATEGVRA